MSNSRPQARSWIKKQIKTKPSSKKSRHVKLLMNQRSSGYTKAIKPGHSWLRRPPPALPTASLEKQSTGRGSRTQSFPARSEYVRALSNSQNYCLVGWVRRVPGSPHQTIFVTSALWWPRFNPCSQPSKPGIDTCSQGISFSFAFLQLWPGSAFMRSRRSHPQAGSHIPPRGPQQHCLWSQPGWLQTLALTSQWLLTKLMALCASASASRTGRNSPSLLGPCDRELTEPGKGARSAAASTPSVGSSTADWVLYKVCVGGHPAFQLDETH